jgi:chromate transport protein ChrA
MTDAASARTKGSLAEVFGAALKLGLTTFGGPIAHLGYFERTYVQKRRRMSASDYASIVGLCQLLPGPSSSQVGFLVGFHRAGWGGALAAWSMARSLCPDLKRKMIAALAAILLLLHGSPTPPWADCSCRFFLSVWRTGLRRRSRCASHTSRCARTRWLALGQCIFDGVRIRPGRARASVYVRGIPRRSGRPRAICCLVGKHRGMRDIPSRPDSGAPTIEAQKSCAGTSAQRWLNLQTQYDLEVASQKTGKKIEKTIQPAVLPGPAPTDQAA